MNLGTLLITSSYIVSSKGEKHHGFKGYLYRHQRENKWRCIQKDYKYVRFKTKKKS